MYYLETNALRALSGSIGKNKELLSNSYTSIFSIFELIKGINRSKDSRTRLQILKQLKDIDLKSINLMPGEMFEAAFESKIHILESEQVKLKISDLLLNTQTCDNEYDEMVRRYEFATKNFQEKISQKYAVPAPPPKKLEINLHDAFSTSETPPYLKELQPNLHPSRIMMEMLKQDRIPYIYRIMNPTSNLNNKEILYLYNNALDLFLIADFGFNLKRKALRQAASKNDLLDIIHTIYLINHEDIIVSDDRIFESILPDINIISVEKYRNLIDPLQIEGACA